jgi:NOL1/NOP2/fmu family ribosome biogenesis protein
MAQNLRILNNKEVKEILEQLREHFGYEGKPEYVWMLAEKKERLYIFTRDLAKLDTSNVMIDSMGLYVASVEGQIRLTIEGSQLFGPHCTKNIIDLDRGELTRWLMGERLTLATLALPQQPVSGVVIVRHDGRFVGCGKVSGEPGAEEIFNFVPKTRHVHASYE